MTRRKPRHLSDEERQLWDRVRHSAKPLNPTRSTGGHAPYDRAGPSFASPTPSTRSETRIPDFRVGESSKSPETPHDLAPDPANRLNGAPVRMDRRGYARLKRGKLAPEARIDLHGMTLERAHPALINFILSSHRQNRRLVLVITGKGKAASEDGPIPRRRGILRHNVPHWLNGPELAHAVLQITPAHQRHGGDGAYYVYLRRQR